MFADTRVARSITALSELHRVIFTGGYSLMFGWFIASCSYANLDVDSTRNALITADHGEVAECVVAFTIRLIQSAGLSIDNSIDLPSGCKPFHLFRCFSVICLRWSDSVRFTGWSDAFVRVVREEFESPEFKTSLQLTGNLQKAFKNPAKVFRLIDFFFFHFETSEASAKSANDHLHPFIHSPSSSFLPKILQIDTALDVSLSNAFRHSRLLN